MLQHFEKNNTGLNLHPCWVITEFFCSVSTRDKLPIVLRASLSQLGFEYESGKWYDKGFSFFVKSKSFGIEF